MVSQPLFIIPDFCINFLSFPKSFKLSEVFHSPYSRGTKSLKKTCLYVFEKLQRNPSVDSGLKFFIFWPYEFDCLGFLTNALQGWDEVRKTSMGLLQGPRLMAWTKTR